MKSRRSMTRRLILWLTATTVVLWLVAAVFGAMIMRDEFDEVFDSALQETAQRLMPLVIGDLYQRDQDSEPRRIGDAEGEHEEYLTYQLRDRDGRVLLRSHQASTQPFEAPLSPGFYDLATHRVFTQAAVSATLFLQVADPLAHRREAMLESALSLFLPLAALAPISVVVIWITVRRALAPIGDLRREIGKRDGGNLDPLRSAALPIELASIASSVDRLLDRLRHAIDAERAFASNSAHELRTPVAGALAQIQRLIAEVPEGPTRARARQVEASLTDLAELAEKLLQLSRAEAGIGRADHPVDLMPVLRLVVTDFHRRAAGSKRLKLLVEDDAALIEAVDIDAFAIVLRNLIENALLHGDLNGPVTVSVDPAARIHRDHEPRHGDRTRPAGQSHSALRARRYHRRRSGAGSRHRQYVGRGYGSQARPPVAGAGRRGWLSGKNRVCRRIDIALKYSGS